MKDIIIKSTLSNIDYIVNFLNIDKNIFSDLKSKIPILYIVKWNKYKRFSFKINIYII